YVRRDITSNYEVSRTSQRTVAATGQVEKLSVSVVVDNITDPATLGAIEQAAIAAAGIDQTRDDVLTVNSIEFDRTLEVEQAAALEETQQREFYFQLAQWGAVGVALLALFFVVRSMLRSLRPPPVKPEIKVEEPDDARAALLEEMSKMTELSPGEVGDLAKIGAPSLDPNQQQAAEKAQMMRQLQLMARNKPETIAQIIQFWLAEDSNHL
ncbi:MAG TPA: flagellar M-ring protein FliF C-terminal domain-containing protein, partial [Anaerolineae bacterium]|nr:flagellar M-ring protein FliF C-terminal domain-containing protein [Anaerolineae bacterium]